MLYGYVRESENQSTDEQVLAIQEYGVEDSRIYKDGQENSASPAYQSLLETIQPGDTVVLKSLDRLGNTYEDMLNEWQRITEKHEAAVVVLDMPLPDTAGALNSRFLSELVYDVMSYIGKNQREYRRQRQSEGISAAQSRGVKFGRRTKIDRGEFDKVRAAYRRGELTVTGAAARLNVSRETFRRWMREYPEERRLEERHLEESNLEERHER